MARRSILVALIAAGAVLLPANALAATAPAAAPVLTSAPYAFPLTLHWTPADDPLNLSQSVYRATGPCTSPPAVGGLITTFPGNSTTDFTGRPVDGTYCYHIRVADLLTTADGPGVTVSVDTTNPSATVAVSGQSRRASSAAAWGSRARARTRSPAWPRASCTPGRPGRALPARCSRSAWDTTAMANGTYEVCNVVTDNAGHSATARLTRDHRQPRAAAAPAAPLRLAPGRRQARGARPGRAQGAHEAQGRAPASTKHRTGIVPVRLRWVNPAAADLDRVVAVLNKRAIAARAGRRPRDLPGARRVGRASRCASDSARTSPCSPSTTAAMSRRRRGCRVSLAALVPLRPLTGKRPAGRAAAALEAAPGTAYYNLQLFHNGTTRARGLALPPVLPHPGAQARARHLRLVRVAGGQAQGRCADVRRADRPRDVRRQAVGTTARTGRSMPGYQHAAV